MQTNDEKAYTKVLEVTGKIRKRERVLAFVMLAFSILNASIYYFWLDERSVLLISVLLFGLAVALVFKRDMDIKLGGLSTYSLLLYYSLDNLYLPLHFFAVTLIGIPLATFFIRRGYLGPMLYYGMSIVLLPLSAYSYVLFSRAYSYSLIANTYRAEEVIYIFLPLIFVHSSLSMRKDLIIKDYLYMAFLICAGLSIWVIVDFLAKLWT